VREKERKKEEKSEHTKIEIEEVVTRTLNWEL
jgi:hypothetical protein